MLPLHPGPWTLSWDSPPTSLTRLPFYYYLHVEACCRVVYSDQDGVCIIHFPYMRFVLSQVIIFGLMTLVNIKWNWKEIRLNVTFVTRREQMGEIGNSPGDFSAMFVYITSWFDFCRTWSVVWEKWEQWLDCWHSSVQQVQRFSWTHVSSVICKL
jgi:hypothetical protein